MPFGLCNASATFERLMEQVLAGLPTTIALLYLDDILVPGCTFDQHITNLRTVFQCLKSANLKLNPKKCARFQKEVKYLGHIVNATDFYGQRFIVHTDHSALQWLLNFRNPEGQVARWLETLQGYDFTVEHRPGSKHTNADAMSRLPCLDTGCQHCTHLESSHGYSLQAHTVTLNMGAGCLIGDSMDLQRAQQNDDDLCPVIAWLKAGMDRPC